MYFCLFFVSYSLNFPIDSVRRLMPMIRQNLKRPLRDTSCDRDKNRRLMFSSDFVFKSGGHGENISDFTA
jgi:hypothetical protein